MRIVSLTYINSSAFDQPMDWINRLYAFTGVLEELSRQHTVYSVEQINYTGDLSHNGVQYHFRNYGNGVNRFPVRLHRFIKRLKPDIILVRGLHFPLQVIQLRMMLGSRVTIICEHHADKISTGWRKRLNRFAGRFVNRFHFTSLGHAQEWIGSGNIKDPNKCREIPAGSTRFSGYDKQQSRVSLGWDNRLHFIWSGRLDSNKDPLTVIYAFSKFIRIHPSARLQMIYLDDPLLPEIDKLREADPLLAGAVIMHGRISQEDIQTWYSAADFYISASHYEGGSIALVEAMACGCIPIITAIPSSLTAIGDGKYGLIFNPGDVNGLYNQLVRSKDIQVDDFSQAVKDHFRNELSFEAIGRKFL